MQAVLIIVTGFLQGQRRWLRPDESLSVGSSHWADFAVSEDPAIAPVHFVVSLTADGCVIAAADGQCVFVNGNPVSTIELVDQDRIQVGSTCFSLNLKQTRVGSSGAATRPSPRAVHPSVTERTVRITCREQGERYICLEPVIDDIEELLRVDGAMIAQRINAQVPLYLLSRFCLWSFPMPEELADSRDYVPPCNRLKKAKHLPLLFSFNHLKSPENIVASGLDGGHLLGILSEMDPPDLLDHLRNVAGLYTSPRSIAGVLKNASAESLVALLGPISGILVGTNRGWQLHVERKLVPDAAALGF